MASQSNDSPEPMSEFDLLRALTASQRHGAAFLLRAEAAARDIEARTAAEVADLCQQPGLLGTPIDEVSTRIEALLRIERHAVGLVLRRMEQQLAVERDRLVGRPPGAPAPLRP